MSTTNTNSIEQFMQEVSKMDSIFRETPTNLSTEKELQELMKSLKKKSKKEKKQ